MKRLLLPMTLVGLFALSLSACGATVNSAATRTASSPITGESGGYTDRHSTRAQERAVYERSTSMNDSARPVRYTPCDPRN